MVQWLPGLVTRHESHLGHILIICGSISRQRPNNEQSAYTGYIEIHYTRNNNNIVLERTAAPHHHTWKYNKPDPNGGTAIINL